MEELLSTERTGCEDLPCWNTLVQKIDLQSHLPVGEKNEFQ